MNDTYYVTRHGLLASDPYEDAVAFPRNIRRAAAIEWTADAGHATILTRARALKLAEQLGGRAVRLTSVGKFEFVRSDRTTRQQIVNAPRPTGGAR